MSSYLLENDNTSFIANAIIDIQRNPQTSDIAYPLLWRGYINRLDYFSKESVLIENKKKLFSELRKMNYIALDARYGLDGEISKIDLTDGYENQGNWLFYNDKCKLYFTLAEVISCYLYQCNEDDVPDSELFKALSEIKSNLYHKVCVLKLGDFNGWASVDDLK